MGDLAGKVALITGSGRGMGRSHALIMAGRGADIVVHDVLKEEADKTAEDVRAMGRCAFVSYADVSDVAAMREAVKEAEAELGGIDILVNNAGIGGERTGIEGVDEAFFQRMYDVHVKGTFFATQAVIPGMKERGWGKIVNISSMWASTGHPTGATYIAAKGAILGLTKSWALEFAPWNITVNAVTPGGVITQMVLEKGGMDYVREASKKVPLGRYAEVEEMSYPVVFLCSPESDFITGQVIGPNGGQSIVGI
jgi:3-oxoacyl-[acyl-carrier protein] reductase